MVTKMYPLSRPTIKKKGLHVYRLFPRMFTNVMWKFSCDVFYKFQYPQIKIVWLQKQNTHISSNDKKKKGDKGEGEWKLLLNLVDVDSKF